MIADPVIAEPVDRCHCRASRSSSLPSQSIVGDNWRHAQ